MKILHLTLKKEAFDVMVTGEKTEEFRIKSRWIKARLFDNKKWIYKEYDYVKFVNGYGNDKPYFIAEYLGYGIRRLEEQQVIRYSNGLEVKVDRGDYIIYLGEIVEKGNLKDEQ